MDLPPFHAAIVVHDLDASRSFYGELLGCLEGRCSDSWVDFNFYGHQLVCHLDSSAAADWYGLHKTNPVDGEDVPVPHFGVVLSMPEWQQLARRLRRQQARFIVDPGIRFVGELGEQATLFIADPTGNVLEFKAFGDPEKLFAS